MDPVPATPVAHRANDVSELLLRTGYAAWRLSATSPFGPDTAPRRLPNRRLGPAAESFVDPGNFLVMLRHPLSVAPVIEADDLWARRLAWCRQAHKERVGHLPAPAGTRDLRRQRLAKDRNCCIRRFDAPAYDAQDTVVLIHRRWQLEAEGFASRHPRHPL